MIEQIIYICKQDKGFTRDSIVFFFDEREDNYA